MKNYQKPLILEETSLQRDLVYAIPETANPRSGCTTVETKIKIEDDDVKLT